MDNVEQRALRMAQLRALRAEHKARRASMPDPFEVMVVTMSVCGLVLASPIVALTVFVLLGGR
jgi:hypothetical protein